VFVMGWLFSIWGCAIGDDGSNVVWTICRDEVRVSGDFFFRVGISGVCYCFGVECIDVWSGFVELVGRGGK